MKSKIKYLFYIIIISLIIEQSINICIPGENCPTYSGFCKLDKCECLPGYQTLITENMNPIFCNYKQYSKWVPFILELFLPSIGLFLILRFFHGFIKLALFVPLVWRGRNISSIWQFLFTLVYIVDLIGIYFKFYEDGNGIPLA